ncbi:Holo-[acyl-carrier-protein] synthase [Alteracholeplasma palmae J233]|uniref:Holo-[acyl-carrier-protein] synthase n=1 Tax=Alteracholeplasma palmae (strain ATCC 49389 / J233) TaxID=1318466 RepID=U4KNF5_ALTPJ|nr:holo-ACP synthase [Alteracholeplasma palmae]CCV63715.1 Holo-[acyl-carrier-protein] synthase [Alteracholeplasma palmae J233]
MDVKGIGIDLVEIQKIREIGLEKFKNRILSEKEILEYNLILNENRKETYLAGRFAAKEALFKAFKKGDLTANYKDFSILNDESNAPYVESKWTKDVKVLISISHTKEYATAFIIINTR